MVGVSWDGLEGATWHWEAELLAYCSRAMRRSCLASCSRLLVFGSSVLDGKRPPPCYRPCGGSATHWEPCEGIIVIVDRGLCCVLPHKLLPLALKPFLGGLQI